MNWRSLLIYLLLYTSGSKIPGILKKIKRWEFASSERIEEISRNKLKNLLLHSYNNVPYYHKILQDSEIVVDGKDRLENFSRIPVLTKEIIRREGNNLYSKDYKRRKAYENFTGGSTGEPVRFIQDKEFDDWHIATMICYKMFAGQNIGDREFRLWGSERDLLKSKETPSVRLKYWIYNRIELNAFKMSEEDMALYVDKINGEKPTWIEAYVQPMYELARFIKNRNIRVNSPRGVLTSAGTLYPEMKDLIEEVFKCRTYNRYGTREVGAVACSCERQEGLHVSVWNNYIEILNENMSSAKPTEVGRIFVTTLNNYSMPLIRYDIGDMAVIGSTQKCSCGRSTPLIANVTGRHMEVFRTKQGKIVPAEFFIHFIGVVHNKKYIRRFQVIQKAYDYIVIKLVVLDIKKFHEFKGDIVTSIKKVMGQDCRIDFDEIPPLKSGKYLYTICEI